MTNPVTTLSLLDPSLDQEQQPSSALPVPDGWPAPPPAAVYHGLAGEIVNTIAPETEADPVAIRPSCWSRSVPRSAAARGFRSRRPFITRTSFWC